VPLSLSHTHKHEEGMVWGKGRKGGDREHAAHERDTHIEGEMKRVILLERWRRPRYPSIQMLCSSL